MQWPAVNINMNSYVLIFTFITFILAQACGVPVGRRLGGRLAMTLVVTINVIIFHYFFSSSGPFLIEEVIRSKNLFSES